MKKQFPVILSPNTGCPELLGAGETAGGGAIPLVVACGPDETLQAGVPSGWRFVLRPCFDGGAEVELGYRGGSIRQIVDWGVITELKGLRATRELIPKELHYKVLGEETTYWRLDLSVAGYTPADSLVRKHDGKPRPRLWDLVLTDASGKQLSANPHSVEFLPDGRKECRFIHLTDLHVAKRNDDIPDEVLKVGNRRARWKIRDAHVNFNDKFRDFIVAANKLVNKGELDFVVITGDLVDFAFHDWREPGDEVENNWKVFLGILTGAGKEGERREKNEGLKVAAFTTTGNHDWRLRPYNPRWKCKSFGLEKDEMANYEYKAFDSADYPDDPRAKRSAEIAGAAYRQLNKAAFKDKPWTWLAKKLSRWWVFLLSGGGGSTFFYTRLAVVYWTGFIVLGIVLISLVVRGLLHWLADQLVENSLRADASALHYYLRNINPYLEYAFECGGHSFIAMDTGPDVFVGDLLDGKKVRRLKRISIEDNLLGGSPDSRGFESSRTCRDWSQIVWLEKVLACVKIEAEKAEVDSKELKTFAFLHAPPVNCGGAGSCSWYELQEKNREDRENLWVSKCECNLTYGTVNHYLSQFFHLCRGHREGEAVLAKGEAEQGNAGQRLGKVDLVFSGHAHWNIEFRVTRETEARKKEATVRIYSDVYSKKGCEVPAGTVIVQTAACGLGGKDATKPPYYRYVSIDSEGHVDDFGVRSPNEQEEPVDIEPNGTPSRWRDLVRWLRRLFRRACWKRARWSVVGERNDAREDPEPRALEGTGEKATVSRKGA